MKLEVYLCLYNFKMKIFKSLVWLFAISFVLQISVANATSSYIHERVVNGVNTISICDPSSNWEKRITMKDRNEWATTNNLSSTGAYGYNYQWWNNQKFVIWCRTYNCPDSVTNRATGTKAIWNSSYDNHWYNWINFIVWSSYDYWENDLFYNNLWWWWSDGPENNRWYDDVENIATNLAWRKWPCWDWYHVPSIWEWNKVLEYWAEENWYHMNDYVDWWKYGNVDWLKFKDDFYIVLGDYYRYHWNGYIYKDDDYTLLWTSSPFTGAAYGRLFVLSSGEVSSAYYDQRALWLSVRCFKDSPENFPGPRSAQLNLSIIKWTLTIWTKTWNLNLWQVNVSNSAQELSWSFGADSFWIEDMKWAESWYYTTISVTDLTWTVATHVISADNVYLKTAWETPSYISWATVSDSKVVFSSAIKSRHNWSTPVYYFHRLNTAASDAWRIWKWWDNLQIKVTIPAHTPSDTYRWTITYTLIDLDL